MTLKCHLLVNTLTVFVVQVSYISLIHDIATTPNKVFIAIQHAK